MLVRDLMKTKLAAVKAGMGYRQVAEILIENKVSGAPVVDENDQLIGIVSEKDLFRAIYPSYREFYEDAWLPLDFERLEREAKGAAEKKVEEFMSKRLITTTPTTPVLKIGGLMVATGIHRVPVVDENGKLVGMVSRRDIYRAILREHFNLWENGEFCPNECILKS